MKERADWLLMMTLCQLLFVDLEALLLAEKQLNIQMQYQMTALINYATKVTKVTIQWLGVGQLLSS